MMQIQLNSKNLFIFVIVFFFVYLAYVIWSADDRVPELDVELKDLISYAVLATEMGGHAIAKIYRESNLNIKRKGDTDVGKAELLTRADLVSNHLILGLLRRFPLVKVITEEKSETLSEHEVEKYRDDNYEIWLNIRQALDKFPSRKYELDRVTMWVDPLDATQEFTEGLTEYVTVMACIAIDGNPIFGAIYRPFFNETIFGLVDFGLLDSTGQSVELRSESQTKRNVVVSRSHAGKVSEAVERAFGADAYTVVPAGGSGYKTLQLIKGEAAIYMHTTAIKKWDVCAGDALIRASGGALLDLRGRPLDYGRRAVEMHWDGLFMARHGPYTLLSKVQKSMTDGGQ